MARRGSVLLIAVGAFLLLAGTASASGPITRAIDGLFWAITWFALLVSVIVYGAMVFFIIRYRESASPVAVPVHGYRSVEILWTVFPTVVLLLITAISVPVLYYTDQPPKADTWVNVLGFQWGWRFTYEDKRTNTSGELWIQEDVVALLNVTSADVIHSFAVPQLGIKIDAVPGRVNRFWLIADTPGTYIVQCAEFCGPPHYGMRGVVHVFAKGTQPRIWGPPPRPLQYTDLELREFGGRGGKPWSIHPAVINATNGETIPLRIWNNNSQSYVFQIDDPFGNVTVSVPPFASVWLNYTPPANIASDISIPYGPNNATARSLGMVGSLNVTIAILIELHDSPYRVSPSPLLLPKGVPLKFLIRNMGPSFDHNFTLGPPYGYVNTDAALRARGGTLPPGGSVVIGPFTLGDDAGSQYWCNVPGHKQGGMFAPYTVGSGGSFVPQESGVPIFEMAAITIGLGVFATFGYVVHHARRRDE